MFPIRARLLLKRPAERAALKKAKTQIERRNRTRSYECGIPHRKKWFQHFTPGAARWRRRKVRPLRSIDSFNSSPQSSIIISGGNIMKIRRLSFSLFLLSSISILTFATEHTAAAATACNQMFLPVCGSLPDGTRMTYTNACFAKVAGARVLHTGPCFGPICLMWYNPVCARSPKGYPRTYPSLCAAENDNAVYIRPGTCK
jgi:hypothetical protein